MSTTSSKINARLNALNLSLDELESKLEPLLDQTLPESVVGLEKIQQAKLQVALPYLVYDLIFIYLKTRGIDPKSHPVVAELDRVRQYFDKIKDAEDPAKRKAVVDKAAANRFIKHAIAQVKLQRTPGEVEVASQTPGSESSSATRVPVKVTTKMLERAKYEQEIKDMGSEEEEDLEVFDEETKKTEPKESSSDDPKGKQRDDSDTMGSSRADKKRRRPAIDPFAGYGDEPPTEVTPASRVSPAAVSDEQTEEPSSDSVATKTKERTVKKAKKKSKRKASTAA